MLNQLIQDKTFLSATLKTVARSLRKKVTYLYTCAHILAKSHITAVTVKRNSQPSETAETTRDVILKTSKKFSIFSNLIFGLGLINAVCAPLNTTEDINF